MILNLFSFCNNKSPRTPQERAPVIVYINGIRIYLYGPRKALDKFKIMEKTTTNEVKNPDKTENTP